MNNKNLIETRPQGAPLLFLYTVSIVVPVDFIAILQTLGIFLIENVNTIRYLIHFYIKNIKMHTATPINTVNRSCMFVMLIEVKNTGD